MQVHSLDAKTKIILSTMMNLVKMTSWASVISYKCGLFSSLGSHNIKPIEHNQILRLTESRPICHFFVFKTLCRFFYVKLM